MSDEKKPKRGPRRPSIRPVSREDPPKGVAALKACRCIDEVERRIRLGWSSADLVKMIQEEYGELTHISEKYCARLIEMFRGELPPADLMLTSKNSTMARHAQRQVVSGLNELEELEKLYKMQMRRIDIDVGNETNINKLFPTTGREIFVAAKLLKQSADLKLDLGLYKKKLGTVEISEGAIDVGTRTGSQTIGQVLADPDSRKKVGDMIKSLVQMGDKLPLDVDSAYTKDVIDVEVEDVSEVVEE